MGMYPLIEEATHALFDKLVKEGLTHEEATERVLEAVDRGLAERAEEQ